MIKPTVNAMQKIGKLYLELGQNMSPLPGTTVDLIHDSTCKVASKRPDQFSLYGANPHQLRKPGSSYCNAGHFHDFMPIKL